MVKPGDSGALVVKGGKIKQDERRATPRIATGMNAFILARHNDGIAFVIECLSLGGARLTGPLTLDVGELVHIMFEIDDRPLHIAGEVVRVESLNIVTDRIAVRFVSLADDARESIRALVLRTLEEEGN